MNQKKVKTIRKNFDKDAMRTENRDYDSRTFQRVMLMIDRKTGQPQPVRYETRQIWNKMGSDRQQFQLAKSVARKSLSEGLFTTT